MKATERKLALLRRSDGKVVLLLKKDLPERTEFKGIVFKKTREKKTYQAGVATVYIEDNTKEAEVVG